MLAYDAFADLLASQYREFEQSITGIYWLAITRYGKHSVEAQNFNERGRMYGSINAFRSTAHALAVNHAVEIGSTPDALADEIKAFDKRIQTIASSIVDACCIAVKRERVRDSMGHRSVGLVAQLEAKARDSIGRKYQGEYMTKLGARHFSVQAHVGALKASGAEQIALKNDLGEVVDVLTFAPGEKSLEALQWKYLHPNTRLKVEPYVAT